VLIMLLVVMWGVLSMLAAFLVACACRGGAAEEATRDYLDAVSDSLHGNSTPYPRN
jgi:hypothetical protein